METLPALVSVPHLNDVVTVLFPSCDISVKLAKEIVLRSIEGIEFGELFGTEKSSGELVRLSDDSSLSLYNISSEIGPSFVYRATKKLCTVVFTKQYFIDEDEDIASILSSLRDIFPTNRDGELKLYTQTDAAVTPEDLRSISSKNPTEPSLTATPLHCLSHSITKFCSDRSLDTSKPVLYVATQEKTHLLLEKPARKDILLKSPRRKNMCLSTNSAFEKPVSPRRSGPIRAKKTRSAANSLVIPKIDLSDVDEVQCSSRTSRERRKRTKERSSTLFGSLKGKLARNKSSDSFGALPIVPPRKEKNLKTAYFGVPLEMILERPTEAKQEIPSVVNKMMDHLRSEGAFKLEGIFRICGQQSSINSLVEEIDNPVLVTDLTRFDLHVISNTFKYYFQSLPDPILSYALYKYFIVAVGTPRRADCLSYLRALLYSLPRCRQNLSRELTCFFKSVSEHKAINKMDTKNLGIILGPLLWRAKESDSDFYENYLENSKHAMQIGKLFIRNVDAIFSPRDPMNFFQSGVDYQSSSSPNFIIVAKDKFSVISEVASCTGEWLVESKEMLGWVDQSFIQHQSHTKLDCTVIEYASINNQPNIFKRRSPRRNKATQQ